MDNPKLMHELIFILMYAEDVALFSYNLDDMQHLLAVVDTFHQISGLTISVDQTKMMAMEAIQSRHYPTFTYKVEPIQVAQHFKYLAMNVSLTNRWNACYQLRFQVGWNTYMF